MSREYDPNYKVPEGFLPWLTYPDEYPDGVPYIGFCILETEKEGCLFFCIKEKIPALPLKAYGKLWYTGWDIPSEWAIDADNQCWLGGGPVEAQELIDDAERDEDKEKFANLLGIEPPEPSWVGKAKLRGWLPPEEIENMREFYEKRFVEMSEQINDLSKEREALIKLLDLGREK